MDMRIPPLKIEILLESNPLSRRRNRLGGQARAATRKGTNGVSIDGVIANKYVF